MFAQGIATVIVELAFAALVCCLVVALLVRRGRRAFQAQVRAWHAKHPSSPDGIVPGAASIAFDAGERAVLLLHGFGDTPQTLERLAHVLHARGWTVRAPLLPGHGRTLESFHASRGEQWSATAREAFESLHATHAPVAIVGLSMGGALATSLAAAVGNRAATLVLLAPFLEVARSGFLLTAAWPIWSVWRAWVPGDAAAAIHDPAARRESLGYGVSSPRALRELRGVVVAAASASRQLHIPTLVIHSRTDYRIPVAAAERGFATLGATEKQLRWVEHSGHVITVDRDATEVIAAVAEWLEQHVPARGVAPPVRSSVGSSVAPSSAPPSAPSGEASADEEPRQQGSERQRP